MTSTPLLDTVAMSPLVIAHRGASRAAPDNTLAAFEAAIAAGADMVELDVRRTADGALVAHHSRSRRGTPLTRLSEEELGRRARHRPPPLREVLALCAGRTGVDVEIKEEGYEDQVLDAVARQPRLRGVVVTSFHGAVVETVKRRSPGTSAGLIVGLAPLRRYGTRIERAVLEPAQRCGADFIVTHQLLVALRPASHRRRYRRSRLLHAAEEAGIPVAVWTVNSRARLRHFIGERGVAAIITDLPAVAIELRHAGWGGLSSQA